MGTSQSKARSAHDTVHNIARPSARALCAAAADVAKVSLGAICALTFIARAVWQVAIANFLHVVGTMDMMQTQHLDRSISASISILI